MDDSTPDKKNREKWFIQSVGKSIACLRTFSRNRPVLTLSEVAKANGMNLATARRYLETFRGLGYVVRDESSKTYQLTPKVLRLGSWVIESMDLRSRLLPFMRALAQRFDITIGCAILDGSEIVYIERFRSSDVVNLDLTVGSRLPAYCTSLGKAILAFLDEETLRSLLDKMNLIPQTRHTITDKAALWEDLQLTASRGYSISDEELTLGVKSIAVPIFNRNRVVAGSLGVSYPSKRGEEDGLKETFIHELLAIAQRVSCP